MYELQADMHKLLSRDQFIAGPMPKRLALKGNSCNEKTGFAKLVD